VTSSAALGVVSGLVHTMLAPPTWHAGTPCMCRVYARTTKVKKKFNFEIYMADREATGGLPVHRQNIFCSAV